jgi:hypothetical protein
MADSFEQRVEKFLQGRMKELGAIRAAQVDELVLLPLLRKRNPYFERVRTSHSVSDIVKSLLEGGTAALRKTLFDDCLRDLAVFVSEEKLKGRKSGIAGIDIELERGDVCHLIAVKSGQAWGNIKQQKKQRDNFATAVKVLRQNKAVGEIQPTLGICYGRIKTVNDGAVLKIGGQSFWELISGESDLYMDIIEPIGHRALEFNEAFAVNCGKAENRMAREFFQRFSVADGNIDWPKIVTLVSKNA